ncbi:GrpB family protein [Halobium palmae]|uniref:GrpB family protein n=1 Tax=Halobium palmae TaxID=1776492 RepID=A0ABD5S4U3_9EURY
MPDPDDDADTDDVGANGDTDDAGADADPGADFGGDVRIVKYDPEWPVHYDRERERIEGALDPEQYVRIEHIGSTSVPGLDAKDIVDVLLVVPDEETAWNCVGPLESVGYEFHREWERREFRLGLGRWPDDGQRVNLSVRTENGDDWRRNLLLRDYVRDHPAARDEYERVKYEAAAAHAEELIEYTRAKSDVVESIVERAREAGYGERL